MINKNNETKIISVVSSKGGVGKTLTAFQLNGFIHHVNPNYKTLLIDCDEQRNLTLLYEDNDNKEALAKSSIYRAYVHDSGNIKSAFPADFKPANVDKNVDMLASSSKLAGVDKLINASNPSFGMYVIFHALHALKILNGVYDYIIIDTHNSLNLLPTKDALFMSDDVIVPVTGSLFGINAVNDLNNDVQKLKGKCVNPMGKSLLHFHTHFIGNMLKRGTNTTKVFLQFTKNNPDFITNFDDREIFQRSINNCLNIFELVDDEYKNKDNHSYNDKKYINKVLIPKYKKIFDIIK